MKLAVLSAALAAALVLATESRTGAATAKGDRAGIGREGAKPPGEDMTPGASAVRPIRIISVDRRETAAPAVHRPDPA